MAQIIRRGNGGTSAFPSIPDKKGHDGQYTKPYDRQGADNLVFGREEFFEREAVEGKHKDPFHGKPEPERDEPHTKPETGKRRQHKSIDHPARGDDHG